MADITGMLQAAAGNAGEDVDPDFANTVLLLHGDGTNGAQNNTFLDSSTNNFTITRNGNTTQGSFSPFSKPDGRWGTYYDGTGDYLNVGTMTALGSGDFTISCWVYPQAISRGVFHVGGLPSSVTGVAVSLSGTALEGWNLYAKNTQAVSNTGPIALNQWYYLTVVRSGTTTTLYVDGVSTIVASSDSTNYTQTSLAIGGFYSTSYLLTGYIADFRIVVGTALAPSGVPTSPSTAISGTSLLTCQSNRFVDNSTNNFAITRNGDVKVTPFSPFPLTTEYSPSVNSGSGYFDGSGDYLSAGSDAALAPGSGDFTIECWLYTIGNANYMGFYQNYTDGNGRATALRMSIYQTDNTRLAVQTAATALITTSTGVLQPNAWNHIALVRNGAGSNNLVLYVNGVSAGTATNTTNFSDGYAQIGNTVYSSVNYSWVGLISNLRVVPGTPVYTAAFTPPTAPLTAVSGTELLCNFTNAGIFDNTGFNNLETVGNAQIDTTTKQFGTGSLEFDGTGDNLLIPSSENLAFGTGSWTVEFWLYPNDVSGLEGLVTIGAFRFFKNDAGLWFLVSASSIANTPPPLATLDQKVLI
jgi:hypothetical protein